MKNNRLGKFRVHRGLFNLNEWENLLPIMGNFVVVRAECLFAGDIIEYTAYSPMFEELPEFCCPPEYQLEIANFENAPAVIKAHRIK